MRRALRASISSRSDFARCSRGSCDASRLKRADCAAKMCRKLAAPPRSAGTGAADTLAALRVLVVTNITPDDAAPWRGRFVREQADALREAGIDVELFSFPAGSRQYLTAVVAIRRRLRRESFDLVHAHFGLAGWCASLAGARPLAVTFHGTDVRHRTVGPLSRRLAPGLDLCAGVSRALFGPEGGRPGLPHVPGASAVLPCGPDL